MMSGSFPQFVDSFRNSSPYINAHKGKTFVLVCGGDVVADGMFSSIVHDIALLSTLGVNLVLVHGSRSQVEAGLQSANAASSVVHGTRVTDARALEQLKAKAVGDKVSVDVGGWAEATSGTPVKIDGTLDEGLLGLREGRGVSGPFPPGGRAGPRATG